MAAALGEIFPLGMALARESREFQSRAVDYVARHGVTQFIDLGSGMPASDAIHEVAGRVSPGARVAYVDNDPVVISHAAALLARPGLVAAVPGDLRFPQDILASQELTDLIDVTKPFCVILTMILNFVGPDEASGIIATLRDAMPGGSFLMIALGVNDDEPAMARDFIQAFSPALVHLHSRAQIAGYFAGLELVEPGLTEARYWRVPVRPADGGPRPADALAGLGRKP
jgi:hypothetical protein